MKPKKMVGRILSAVLTVCMVVTLAPAFDVNGSFTAHAASSVNTRVGTISSSTPVGMKLTTGRWDVTANTTLDARSSSSQNGLKIASGAKVIINIPKGITLTVYGSNGGGTNPGYAGILLPGNSELIIAGEGTLNAYGGAGGSACSGSTYIASNGSAVSSEYMASGNATGDTLGWGGNYMYVSLIPGSGGVGGAGAGGAGAGIGTNGGAGGAGGVQQVDEDRTNCYYDNTWECVGEFSFEAGLKTMTNASNTKRYNHITKKWEAYAQKTFNNGGTDGGNGSSSAGMGTLSVAGATINAKAGATSNIAGNGAANSNAYSGDALWHSSGVVITVSAGTGGGGGGAAYNAADIGAGGAGGGGGGAGGGGSVKMLNASAGSDSINAISGQSGRGGNGGNANGENGAEPSVTYTYRNGNSMCKTCLNQRLNSNGEVTLQVSSEPQTKRANTVTYVRDGAIAGGNGGNAGTQGSNGTYNKTYSGNLLETNITLNNNGADKKTGTTSIQAEYGQKLQAIIKVPEKTACTFEGYYLGNVMYYDRDGQRTYNDNYTEVDDITLTATWSAGNDVTTITLNNNGADIEKGTASIPAEYGKKLTTTVIVVPQKTNYIFEGYYDGTTKYYDQNGKLTYSSDYSFRTDKTLVAKWRAGSLKTTITLDNKGADIEKGTPSIQAQDGEVLAISKIIVPQKTNCIFDGYYYGNTKYYDNTGKLTYTSAYKGVVNITLTAKWLDDKNGNGIDDTKETYYITYNANGGTGTQTVKNLLYNTNVTPLDGAVIKRDKAKLLGWTKEEATRDQIANLEDEVIIKEASNFVPLIKPYTVANKAETFYAVWAVDNNRDGVADYMEPKIDVEIWNQVQRIRLQSAVVGQAIELDALSGRIGYAFIGYVFDQNKAAADLKIDGVLPDGIINDSYILTDADNAAKKVNLYALWGDDKNKNGIADIVEDKYTVDFVDADGNRIDGAGASGMIVKDTLQVPKTKAKEKCKLVGWSTTKLADFAESAEITGLTLKSTDDVYTVAASDAAAGTKVVTLYPVWQKDETIYKISFNANGGTGAFSDDYLNAGTVVNLPMNSIFENGLSRVMVGWIADNVPSEIGKTDREPVGLIKGSTYEMPAKNTTLYIVWATDEDRNKIADYLETSTKATYTVEYNSNNGDGGLDATKATPHEVGSNIDTLTQKASGYTKSGFILLGWTVDKAEAPVGINGKEPSYIVLGEKYQVPERNSILYAVWAQDADGDGIADYKQHNYSLKFDSNGGKPGPSIPINQVYKATQTLVLGDYGCTYDGYNLLGWSETKIEKPLSANDDCPGSVILVGDTYTMPANNTVLYAVWQSKTIYTISLAANGGTPGTTKSLQYSDGEEITLSGYGFVRDGYVLVGWSKEARADLEVDGTLSSEDYAVDSPYTVDKNELRLYAVWRIAAVADYTLIYDGNEATSGVVASETHKAGDAVVLPGIGGYERTNYVQVGWSTTKIKTPLAKSDRVPVDVLEMGGTYNMPEKDATLYAVWQEVASSKLNLRFDANGGDGTKTKQYEENDAVTLPDSGFTKTDCKLIGWSETQYQEPLNEGETLPAGDYAPGSTYTMGAADKTLYAVWQDSPAVKFAVTLHANNGTDEQSTNKYSSGEIIKPDSTQFAYSGYKAVGWSDKAVAPIESGTALPNGAFRLSTSYTVPNHAVDLYVVWEIVSSPQRLWGDVNNDGNVNINDIQRIYGHINGRRPLTDPVDLMIADVNGDSKIGVNDVQHLYNHITGKNPYKG